MRGHIHQQCVTVRGIWEQNRAILDPAERRGELLPGLPFLQLLDLRTLSCDLQLAERVELLNELFHGL